MSQEKPNTPPGSNLGLFDQMLEQTPTSEKPDARQPETQSPSSDDDAARNLAAQTAEPQAAPATLPNDAKRALVALLRQGLVLADKKKTHFEALLRYREAVEAHLDNLFLDLLIDDKAGLALIKQRETESEEEDISTLIPRRALSLYDSLLLIVLRRHYQQREAEGANRVLIDRAQIEAQLRPFLPLSNSSKQDARKLSGALDKLEKHKLLQPQRGEDERFEITAVIRYVVNAELLQQLLLEYSELAAAANIDLQVEKHDE